MGKKRITQLLDKLQANQQAELKNTAAIFTVAQVAVNELQAQANLSPDLNLPALPAGSTLIDRAELERRYGSFNGCRQAAKQQGIRFSKTPSWQQMVAAFNYVETFRTLLKTYIEQYPNEHLRGITFELTLD